jgi:pyruvate ferredoxin oxidoreductase gamma subunit
VPTPQWGYDNAPIGGINPLFGSTVSSDVSAAREGFLPLFSPDKCIHCGLCDSTCPDMVFQFLMGEWRGKTMMMNRGLDYHHCKGCLRCVDVCPTGALAAGEERAHPVPAHFVRNKDLIVDELDFEVSGADPVVTGEGYLTEKRQEGGAL